jgi:hypothetical protein
MMQFYVDDPTKPFLIETPSDLPSGDTWPFNAQIFLLANIAVGGTLGGTPSASTPNPGIMMLDYVRQYQPSAAVGAPVLGTPPSISVTAGATSGNTSTISPTLVSGTGYVYFSCSTSAPKSTCALTSTDPLNKYVVSAGTAETVTVAVMTTANTATSKSIPPPRFFEPKTRSWQPTAMLGFLVSIFMAPLARRPRGARLYPCTLIAGLILTVSAWSCGGGSSNTTVTPPNNGTPPGSYSVTVYAFTESNSSDGSNSHADASVSIPLMVN